VTEGRRRGNKAVSDCGCNFFLFCFLCTTCSRVKSHGCLHALARSKQPSFMNQLFEDAEEHGSRGEQRHNRVWSSRSPPPCSPRVPEVRAKFQAARHVLKRWPSTVGRLVTLGHIVNKQRPAKQRAQFRSRLLAPLLSLSRPLSPLPRDETYCRCAHALRGEALPRRLARCVQHASFANASPTLTAIMQCTDVKRCLPLPSPLPLPCSGLRGGGPRT
jgi:hypothetical protein